jgi:hypothetical protein
MIVSILFTPFEVMSRGTGKKAIEFRHDLSNKKDDKWIDIRIVAIENILWKEEYSARTILGGALEYVLESSQVRSYSG